MADNVNDHIKTNDASAQQPQHADVQTGATNAMARDSMTSAPGASGSGLDGGHYSPYSADAHIGATDALQHEMQKGMIGALNEVWNKPMNAELAQAKPDASALNQAHQDKAILAGYGITDMEHGHGENAAKGAEMKRVDAEKATVAFNQLFDNVGSGKSQANMRSNSDGRAMFGNNNPHLQFSGHQQLSFA